MEAPCAPAEPLLQECWCRAFCACCPGGRTSRSSSPNTLPYSEERKAGRKRAFCRLSGLLETRCSPDKPARLMGEHTRCCPAGLLVEKTSSSLDIILQPCSNRSCPGSLVFSLNVPGVSAGVSNHHSASLLSAGEETLAAHLPSPQGQGEGRGMQWERLSTGAAEGRLKQGPQEPLVLSQLLTPISILRVWHQRDAAYADLSSLCPLCSGTLSEEQNIKCHTSSGMKAHRPCIHRVSIGKQMAGTPQGSGCGQSLPCCAHREIIGAVNGINGRVEHSSLA